MLDWLNPLKHISDAISKAYAAKLAAANDKERIEADKQIAYWQDQMALARAAAEHDKWYSPRSLMGYCATIVVAKLLVWDTVFGLGVTQNPGNFVLSVTITIIGFYFGSKALVDLGAKIAGAIGRK